jgi:hypothetical protein
MLIEVALPFVVLTISIVFVLCMARHIDRRRKAKVLKAAVHRLPRLSLEEAIAWMTEAGVINETGFGILRAESLDPLIGQGRPLLKTVDLALCLSSLVHSEKVSVYSLAELIIKRFPKTKDRKALYGAMNKRREGTGKELHDEVVRVLNLKWAALDKEKTAAILSEGLTVAKAVSNRETRN